MEIMMVSVLAFSETSRSIINLAIWLDVFSDLTHCFQREGLHYPGSHLLSLVSYGRICIALCHYRKRKYLFSSPIPISFLFDCFSSIMSNSSSMLMLYESLCGCFVILTCCILKFGFIYVPENNCFLVMQYR